jgi:hypothetical protein
MRVASGHTLVGLQISRAARELARLINEPGSARSTKLDKARELDPIKA